VDKEYGHLVGRAMKHVTGRGKGWSQKLPLYEVAWEFSGLGTTTICSSYLLDAMKEHYEKFVRVPVQSQNQSRSRVIRDPTRGMGLQVFAFRSDEVGDVCPSESSDGGDDDNIVSDSLCDDHNFIEDEEKNDWSEQDLGLLGGLMWKSTPIDYVIEPPADKMEDRPSTLLPGAATKWVYSPISAFLAFLPIALWEKIAHETSRYARQVMTNNNTNMIASRKWVRAVSLTEIMQFFGILLKMVLYPLPGQSYAAYWDNPELYSFVKHMRLSRFRQI
jgi:hypothetical protein